MKTKNLPCALDPKSGETISEPPVDILDNGSHFIILIDLPGFKRDAIRLQLEKNRLIVSGGRLRPPAGSVLLSTEFETAARLRTFTLAKPLSPKNLGISFENGVLKLVVPRNAIASARRRRNTS